MLVNMMRGTGICSRYWFMERPDLSVIGGSPAVTRAAGAGGVPGKPADLVEKVSQDAVNDGPRRAPVSNSWSHP